MSTENPSSPEGAEESQQRFRSSIVCNLAVLRYMPEGEKRPITVAELRKCATNLEKTLRVLGDTFEKDLHHLGDLITLLPASEGAFRQSDEAARLDDFLHGVFVRLEELGKAANCSPAIINDLSSAIKGFKTKLASLRDFEPAKDLPQYAEINVELGFVLPAWLASAVKETLPEALIELVKQQIEANGSATGPGQSSEAREATSSKKKPSK